MIAPPAPKVLPLPPDPALEAWNATKATESVNALEAFIGNYPKSFYAELAKVRINELKRGQQLAAVPPAPPHGPSPDPALEAWNATKNTETVSVLETFVDKHPLSFYAEVAKAKIDALKKEQEATRPAMVREIQKALKDIDCYGGVIDGVWSDGSRKALDRFSRLAKFGSTPVEPVQATLDSLKAWKGEPCAVEKVATPRGEKATPTARERPPAKVAQNSVRLHPRWRRLLAQTRPKGGPSAIQRRR